MDEPIEHRVKANGIELAWFEWGREHRGDGPTLLLIQMMGALYLGFAILNWTARGVIIGGIYARPLALGNFLHFAMVAVMLAREAIEHGVIQLASSAFVFGVFAVGFGFLVFRPPAPRRPEGEGE